MVGNLERTKYALFPSGAIEWQPLSESFDLCATSQFGMRRYLPENRSSPNAYNVDSGPGGSSTSLVPARK